MFVWVVRIMVLFAVLTAIYLGLSLYNRWAERRRLGAEFEKRGTEGEAAAQDKTEFVGAGMTAYERSLRKKLLLGVYLVPLGIVILLIAVAQIG